MRRGIWYVAVALAAGLTLAMAFGSSAQPAQAEIAAPTPTSPPPTWTPGPPPEKTVAQPSSGEQTGATSRGVITLLARCRSDDSNCTDRLPSLWTQVEAQNADGSWAPISGWGGNLAQIERSQGQISWWFGTQALPPLRWVISEGREGSRTAVSDTFQPLPSSPTVIAVDIPGAVVLLPASGNATIALTLVGLIALSLVATIVGQREESHLDP